MIFAGIDPPPHALDQHRQRTPMGMRLVFIELEIELTQQLCLAALGPVDAKVAAVCHRGRLRNRPWQRKAATPSPTLRRRCQASLANTLIMRSAGMPVATRFMLRRDHNLAHSANGKTVKVPA